MNMHFFAQKKARNYLHLIKRNKLAFNPYKFVN